MDRPPAHRRRQRTIEGEAGGKATSRNPPDAIMPDGQTFDMPFDPGRAAHPRAMRGEQGVPRTDNVPNPVIDFPRRQVLVDAVQRHALPRLLAARRGGQAASRVQPAEAAELARCASSSDFSIVEALAAALAERGASRDDMLLNWLIPAARGLSGMWRRDEATFCDVARGVERLRRLLRSPVLPQAPSFGGQPRGIALASALPGDLISIEPAVVADAFRAAGWEAESIDPRTQDALAAAVASRACDVLILSLGLNADRKAVAALIGRLRRSSANPAMAILVSRGMRGRGVDPQRRMGEDASVADARAALASANGLPRRRAS